MASDSFAQVATAAASRLAGAQALRSSSLISLLSAAATAVSSLPICFSTMHISQARCRLTAQAPVASMKLRALVVLERDMERLMDVGHPMPEALEQPQRSLGSCARGKIARVVQDRGGDAAVSRGAEVGRVR